MASQTIKNQKQAYLQGKSSKISHFSQLKYNKKIQVRLIIENKNIFKANHQKLAFFRN